MGKFSVFLLPVVLLFGLLGVSSATIIEINDSVLFDDINEMYWVTDFTLFTNQTYYEQLDSIISLSLEPDFDLPIAEWRMATYSDINPMRDEYLQAGQSDFVQHVTPWCQQGNHFMISGRLNHVWDDSTSVFDVEWYTPVLPGSAVGPWCPGPLPHPVTDTHLSAWVCAEVVPVPEPATMFLLGSALSGFAAFRKFIKK